MMPLRPAGECTLGGAKTITCDACRKKTNSVSIAPDGRRVCNSCRAGGRVPAAAERRGDRRACVRVDGPHGSAMTMRLGRNKTEELAWLLSQPRVRFTIQFAGIRTEFVLKHEDKKSVLVSGREAASP